MGAKLAGRRLRGCAENGCTFAVAAHAHFLIFFVLALNAPPYMGQCCKRVGVPSVARVMAPSTLAWLRVGPCLQMVLRHSTLTRPLVSFWETSEYEVSTR